jgi:hypothetical protein
MWAAPSSPLSSRNLPHARKEGTCQRLVYHVDAAAAAHWHRSLVPTLQRACTVWCAWARAVLKAAAANVDREGLQGSSTCCVVLIDSAQARRPPSLRTCLARAACWEQRAACC